MVALPSKPGQVVLIVSLLLPALLTGVADETWLYSRLGVLVVLVKQQPSCSLKTTTRLW